MTNDNWEAEDISIDLKSLGARLGSLVSITAVGNRLEPSNMISTYHGEVVKHQAIGFEDSMRISVPSKTVFVMTVPTANSKTTFIKAEAAVALSPVSSHTRGENFMITTSKVENNGRPSILLLNFREGIHYVDKGLVHATLQLHVTNQSTNIQEQVVTVLGFRQNWETKDVTWSNINILKPFDDSNTLSKSWDNFIDWESSKNPTIVGHMTIPPALSVPDDGVFVRLDVTNALLEGISSFSIVRMIRYDETGMDQRTALPQDKPQGRYVFTSLDTGNSHVEPHIVSEIETEDSSSPEEEPSKQQQCQYGGVYMIHSLVCKERYMTHSLNKEKNKIYIKSREKARNPRRKWYIRKAAESSKTKIKAMVSAQHAFMLSCID